MSFNFKGLYFFAMILMIPALVTATQYSAERGDTKSAVISAVLAAVNAVGFTSVLLERSKL